MAQMTRQQLEEALAEERKLANLNLRNITPDEQAVIFKLALEFYRSLWISVVWGSDKTEELPEITDATT